MLRTVLRNKGGTNKHIKPLCIVMIWNIFSIFPRKDESFLNMFLYLSRRQYSSHDSMKQIWFFTPHQIELLIQFDVIPVILYSLQQLPSRNHVSELRRSKRNSNSGRTYLCTSFYMWSSQEIQSSAWDAITNTCKTRKCSIKLIQMSLYDLDKE